ncbi:MAG: ABC transporter ATP-binding protein [Acidimicrobiales bacterium]|nr:ABC transporter ATP-binding protein [Acidimicrobiia bacterium]
MSQQADPAIQVQGVSKSYRLVRDRPTSVKEAVVRRSRRQTVEDFWALRDIDLEVPRGSFFGLIGHNGSGKSTLLKLLAGIHRQTSGDITVNGRLSALLELGAGFHPELTGRENIYLNGAILGMSRRQMSAAVDEIVEFSGIGDFVDAPVRIYSSGMYVRLGFAIAVHVNPEVLLVDEVIAVGDEDFQRKCLDHMEVLRSQGVTIVLVSHDLDQVRELCDQVAWIDRSHLVEVGEPNEVCDRYIASVNVERQEEL